MIFQFPQNKFIQYENVSAFVARVGGWLSQREAENCHIYPAIGQIAAGARAGGLFAIEDHEKILAAGCLTPDGRLCITWATPDMIALMVSKFSAGGREIRAVQAPAFAAWDFSQSWAAAMNLTCQTGREQRVYQLERITFNPPASGRLERALPQDAGLVAQWLGQYAQETSGEISDAATLADALITSGRIFLWKNPGAVAMAACPVPTAHGGAIDYIFVPPQFRGKGHGKAVVGALAHHMIAGGLRYCFFLADIQDRRANRLFQSLSARTVSEMLCCTLHPAATPALQTSHV